MKTESEREMFRISHARTYVRQYATKKELERARKILLEKRGKLHGAR